MKMRKKMNIKRKKERKATTKIYRRKKKKIMKSDFHLENTHSPGGNDVHMGVGELVGVKCER